MDGSWRVDRPQDVTLTGGCIGLGIRVPTVANGNEIAYLLFLNLYRSDAV